MDFELYLDLASEIECRCTRVKRAVTLGGVLEVSGYVEGVSWVYEVQKLGNYL